MVFALLVVATVQQESFVKSALPDGIESILRTQTLPNQAYGPKPAHEFNLLTTVSSKIGDAQSDRFRVFGSVPEKLLTTAGAARFLARLFDYNYTVLRLDHSRLYGSQKVDVYLSTSGVAGGEQLVSPDPTTLDTFGRPTLSNVCYVYDVSTLDDPLEACRELAHEYGHATLPPVRVPEGREEWANGHLGERIYLSHLRTQLSAGFLETSELFGASKDSLDRYFLKKVWPAVLGVAKNGPNFVALGQKGDAAFSAYLALACYTHELMPAGVFRRTLVLDQDQSVPSFAKAILEASSEPKNVEIRVPHAGPVWIPLGSSRLSGAKVLAKKNGWAKVQPTGTVTLLNPDS